MPVSLNNIQYFSVNETADRIGVTRQTIWRWRQDGNVPRGRKYRNREVLFTEEEVALIEEYAHRLEPIEAMSHDQFGLFNSEGE